MPPGDFAVCVIAASSDVLDHAGIQPLVASGGSGSARNQINRSRAWRAASRGCWSVMEQDLLDLLTISFQGECPDVSGRIDDRCIVDLVRLAVRRVLLQKYCASGNRARYPVGHVGDA